MTQVDCEAVKDLPAIVINTSFLLAKWAPVLYACDPWWWNEYIRDVRQDFKGELWTQSEIAAKQHKLHYIRSERKEGLSKDPEVIYQGANSGYQAINLAYHFGASKIILLGYDMASKGGHDHWHKPHKHNVQNAYRRWIAAFEKLAWDLAAEKVAVVNCTRTTALRCFPVRDLDEELKLAKIGLLTA